MSHESFEQFRSLVLCDESLQEPLREIADTEVFVERLTGLGAQLGFDFSADEVLAAMSEMRRVWIERWV